MDILAVMALIAKGVSIATAAVEIGKDAVPALTAVKDLVTSFQAGAVTPQTLADTEASLDALIDEFNAPI